MEANQREVLTAGVLSQLANFYGIEGLGFHHNMGALPSPGALEMMTLAGGTALSGTHGGLQGIMGQALQSAVNPLTLATAGSVLPNTASAQGSVNWLGMPGLSGLTTEGSQSVGGMDDTAQAYYSTLGAGQVSAIYEPSSMQPHAGTANSAAAAAVLASQAAGNAVRSKGQLAGAVVSTAGQVAGTLISTAGQIKGQIVSNAAQVKGSVMGHAADMKGQIITDAGEVAGQAITGIARAAEIVAENKDKIMGAVGTTVGTALINAGELLLSRVNNGATHAAYITSGDYSDDAVMTDTSDTGDAVYYYEDHAATGVTDGIADSVVADSVVAPSMPSSITAQQPAPLQQSTSSYQPAAATATGAPTATATQIRTSDQWIQPGQGR